MPFAWFYFKLFKNRTIIKYLGLIVQEVVKAFSMVLTYANSFNRCSVRFCWITFVVFPLILRVLQVKLFHEIVSICFANIEAAADA